MDPHPPRREAAGGLPPPARARAQARVRASSAPRRIHSWRVVRVPRGGALLRSSGIVRRDAASWARRVAGERIRSRLGSSAPGGHSIQGGCDKCPLWKMA